MTTIDCDGISHNFFAFLARDNRKMESCRVFIPPTVVFDQGFASAWYTSTANMEIKKRKDNKGLNAAEIYKEFSTTHHPNADICAMFLTSSKTYFVDELKPEVTDTTYFTKDGLYEFLFSPGQKPRGILQKFEYPKGWCSTSIQATWSPKLCITEAIRNPNSLYDKTKPVAERAGTHECSMAHQVSITNSVTMAVRQLCAIIVQHFYQVDHVELARMILHFKVDRHNRVVLLYSTSLRTASSSLGVKAKSILPVNLIHRFAGEAEQRTAETNKMIDDLKQRKVSQVKDPSVVAAHHSFSSSSVYKYAAAKIIEMETKKRKSTLVTPAFFGQVAHFGRRWIPLKLSPLEAPTFEVKKKAHSGEENSTVQNRKVQRAETTEPGHSETEEYLGRSRGPVIADDDVFEENPREEVRQAIEELLYELTYQEYFRCEDEQYNCRFSKAVLDIAGGVSSFLHLFGTLTIQVLPEVGPDTELYPSGSSAEGATSVRVTVVPKTWSADVAMCRSNVNWFCQQTTQSVATVPPTKDEQSMAPSQRAHSSLY